MQFRHDFSNMEKGENKKKKDRVPTKKELLNNLNQDNQKETEKWVDLKYYKKESYQSHQILEKLSYDKATNPPEISHLSQEDYFKLIFKNINNEAITEKLNEKVYQTDKILSCNDLIKLPLADQINIIFKKASVLSFDIILNVLGVESEDKKSSLENAKKIINSNNVEKKFNSYQNKVSKLTEKQALELILNYGQVLKSGNFIYKSENKYDYITDSKKRESMIKQRNTIIQFLQNNSQNGIKKNYFNGANEEILKEILTESCECINGYYFLRESIFSKTKADDFKKNYRDVYLKGISYWQNFAYDTSIKLGYLSDEQVLKKIEDLEIIENNLNQTITQKRKYSLNYANTVLSTNKKDENKIKVPLALSRNNNSNSNLLSDSDYTIEKMKDGIDKNVKIKFDGNANLEANENEMQIDDENKADDLNKANLVKIENGKKSDKNIIKLEQKRDFEGNQKQVQTKNEIGINLNIIKDFLIKNSNIESANQKSDIINKIHSEFPNIKDDSKGDEIISKIIKEMFCEIRNKYYLREIEDKELNKVWTVLLDMFFKGNSYKKVDIKKELNEKNVQITDQSLNKILKRIAIYTNSAWNLKE